MIRGSPKTRRVFGVVARHAQVTATSSCRSSPACRCPKGRRCSTHWPRVSPPPLGAVLPLHDGARVANALKPRADAMAAGVDRARALWPRVSLAAGTRLHRLRRAVGPGALPQSRRRDCLAAYALSLYALALAPRRFALGGVLLGLAAGLAFLCRGALGPALMGAHGCPVAAVRRVAPAPVCGDAGDRPRRRGTA